MIRATLVYCFIGVYVTLLAPVGCLWKAATGSAHLLFGMTRLCIRVAGWLGGVRVDVEGRERLATVRNCVILSNHQGNFDGPVLLHVTGWDLRALIKKELLRVPVLSWVFKGTDYVPLDRRDPKQARAGIEQAVGMLRSGMSFFAFPEGTRSRDGALGRFKKGAFIMAIQAGVPVVPVTICGSAAIQPPGGYGIRPGRIRLAIHAPIETRGMTVEDRDRLMRETRDAIASKL
ncbi:MAG: 1-acyl-sn-glycerol-3-phosphate acyltransferase [Acidobacteriota bacterium]|jgi:1-acyl-sn-glycerol-3-phosphate acyltransferase|nr:1-acyl-sn-glycerol-3-phosphate acyltransferase [Acidobacteriota bacterium]